MQVRERDAYGPNCQWWNPSAKCVRAQTGVETGVLVYVWYSTVYRVLPVCCCCCCCCVVCRFCLSDFRDPLYVMPAGMMWIAFVVCNGSAACTDGGQKGSKSALLKAGIAINEQNSKVRNNILSEQCCNFECVQKAIHSGSMFYSTN